MRIRIDDDFNNDLDAEYKSIDNDTIVGNGALSKENIPIVDVKSEEVKEEKIDGRTIKKEEINKYNLNNGFSIEIQGATLLDDNDAKNYINKKLPDDNLDMNNKAELRNRKKENDEYLSNKSQRVKGKITVGVRLGDRKGTPISEAKINLYALNGLSPKLVSSKLTDINGIVVFDSLSEGSYRVIEIVNRKYFEKPTYIQWNEVTINDELQEENIIVVNRVKRHSR